jgi:membrane associated rhomboid family serine protease
MANANTELLEIVLRDCAAARPHPWYPAHFAKATGVAREPLDHCLDQLRLNGLVQLTPWIQGHGQGYELTPYGAEVLEQPRLLGRLREGVVPPPRRQTAQPSLERHALSDARGEKVRAALLDDSRPLVTQVLVALNIIWFFVGLWVYTSRYGGNPMDYLGGGAGPKLFSTYEDTGSLFVVDVIDRHQWWRLLSYGFLHGGFLHIGMNMYALYVLGPLLERMWGRPIFLAIYLVSCIGSGATALVFSPVGYLVGASGAICGLLGSMATWVYLNRHELPPHVVQAWRSNIMINVVLIGIISFFPGISLAGHAGGGLTGLVISAPLNLARFGSGPRRWLGWAGMTAIAGVGLCLVYFQLVRFASSEPMQEMRAFQALVKSKAGLDKPHEDDQADPSAKREVRKAKSQLELLLKAEEVAKEAESNGSKVLRSQKRPDEATAKDLQEQFRTAQTRLEEDVATLSKAGPFQTPELANVFKTGQAFLAARAKLCAKLAKALEPDGPWPPDNWKELRSEHKRIEELYTNYGAAWRQLKPLLQAK